MFKRVRWVGIGAVLGAGGSVYAQVKMRRTAKRYLPPEVGARVAGRARALGDDVLDALAEGRQAMQEREAELRARIDPGALRPSHAVRDVASRPVGWAGGHRLPPAAGGDATGAALPGQIPTPLTGRDRSARRGRAARRR